MTITNQRTPVFYFDKQINAFKKRRFFIEQALYAAESGSYSTMRSHLKSASKYAPECGLDIPEKMVSKLEYICLKSLLRIEARNAIIKLNGKLSLFGQDYIYEHLTLKDIKDALDKAVEQQAEENGLFKEYRKE
jgi:hypothetical protein